MQPVQLTDDHIIAGLQAAVAPLQCHAEFLARATKLSLRIYTDAEVIIGLRDLPARGLRRALDFTAFTEQLRHSLAVKGLR